MPPMLEYDIQYKGINSTRTWGSRIHTHKQYKYYKYVC
jgi:hypothetical protein